MKKRKYNGFINITVKAKVTDDSKNKLDKIAAEYTNYQKYMQSHCKIDAELYSTTKVQAQRALRRIKQPDPRKEYPVILRNDLVGIHKDRKFEGVYWIKIPVYPFSGGRLGYT
ncbi:MAG: hypothetical protein WBF33_15850 [Candidatus Nitrosopolaris sp.]|jgi:hypothetical protein